MAWQSDQGQPLLPKVPANKTTADSQKCENESLPLTVVGRQEAADPERCALQCPASRADERAMLEARQKAPAGLITFAIKTHGFGYVFARC